MDQILVFLDQHEYDVQNLENIFGFVDENGFNVVNGKYKKLYDLLPIDSFYIKYNDDLNIYIVSTFKKDEYEKITDFNKNFIRLNKLKDLYDE